MFLAEVLVFIALGELVGYGWAVLVVALVSVLGLVLLRREGLRAWHGFRQAAEAGQPPGRQVTDGVVGLGGALLLATPGLISGVAGLLLLSPPVRGLARGRVQARAERQMSSSQAGEMFGPRRVRVWRTDQPGDTPGHEPDDEVVEGEVVDPDGPPRRPDA